FRNNGSVAWRPNRMLPTFTLITRCQSLSDVSAMLALKAMPALLIRQSSRPNSLSIPLTTRLQSSAEVTSSCHHPSNLRFTRAPPVPVPTVRAPERDSAAQSARPIPPRAPVTSATAPLSASLTDSFGSDLACIYSLPALSLAHILDRPNFR